MNSTTRSVTVTPQKRKFLSDYERFFPPFFLHPHTVLALQSRFSRDVGGVEYARTKIDEGLGQIKEESDELIKAFNPIELLHISPHTQNRRSQHHVVRDIVARMHGTFQHPVDLTESIPKSSRQPINLLATVSIKYLKFAEDVRPPYVGTYSKILDSRVYSKLCRNPFSRSLPTNYDYDSEAEWEEPGEGEDLESEGEEEAGDDDEGDEMEEFLDDDDETGDGSRMMNIRRRPILGDLEPTSTGLCWEDMHHSAHRKDGGTDLGLYGIEIIPGE